MSGFLYSVPHLANLIPSNFWFWTLLKTIYVWAAPRPVKLVMLPMRVHFITTGVTQPIFKKCLVLKTYIAKKKLISAN